MDLESTLQLAADGTCSAERRERAFHDLANENVDPSALPVVLLGLADPVLRGGALSALKTIGSDEARRALLDLLAKEATPHDASWLGALSDLGWSSPWRGDELRRAVKFLSAGLGLGGEGLWTAASALGALSGLPELPIEERRELVRLLEPVAMDPSEDCLAGIHRHAAIETLGRIAIAEVVPVLEKCLALPGEQNRECARRVLAALKLPEARAAFRRHRLALVLVRPLLGYSAINLGLVALASTLLAKVFAAPWPWAIGAASVAVLIAAVPSVAGYLKSWRSHALSDSFLLYWMGTATIVLLFAALSVEVWRSWGAWGHVAAAVLVLLALGQLVLFWAKAASAS